MCHLHRGVESRQTPISQPPANAKMQRSPLFPCAIAVYHKQHLLEHQPRPCHPSSLPLNHRPIPIPIPIPIRVSVSVCRLSLAPDRHFLHLLPQLVTASRRRRRLLAARQALADGQDAVHNDRVDALLDLAL